jgi:hypothetical protein
MSCRNNETNNDVDNAIPVAMVWINGSVYCKCSQEKKLPNPNISK